MEIGKIDRISFKNRYENELEIIKTGDVEFKILKLPMDFMRTSLTGQGEVIMFDPPGGPFITANHNNQPGVDMGWFNPEWKYFVIEKIDLDYKRKTARLTCIYTKPIDWIGIK